MIPYFFFYTYLHLSVTANVENVTSETDAGLTVLLYFIVMFFFCLERL